ncbi:MAG: hypothetical protein ACODAJ_07665 [Planctomycetota bacterium]
MADKVSDHRYRARAWARMASYTVRGAEKEDGNRTMEKVAQIPVPDGFTPFHVRANNAGFQLVQLTSHVPVQAAPYDPTGAMLVHRGALVQVPEGPCKGPFIVSREKEHPIESAAVNGLLTAFFLMKRTERGAVIAVHEGRLFHYVERVLFEGKHVAEIARHGGGGWKPVFRHGQDKPLDRRQLQALGRYYTLMHDLERHRVVWATYPFAEPTIEFDPAAGTWRLEYSVGRRDLTGHFWTLTIGGDGKLLDYSASHVLR